MVIFFTLGFCKTLCKIIENAINWAQFIAFSIILHKVLQNPRVKKITKEFFIIKLSFLKNIFFQSMPISIAICGYAIAATFIFTYK